nr:hypothetical protein [Tanacetum cinerariifolium]
PVWGCDIIETIDADFDELVTMASEQSTSGPTLHEMTPGKISSGLVQNLLLQHHEGLLLPPKQTPPKTDKTLCTRLLLDLLLIKDILLRGMISSTSSHIESIPVLIHFTLFDEVDIVAPN